MAVGLFPLLEKEGWPRHQQKVPVPKRSGRGGQFGETFRRADHPGCAVSVASRLFVSAQPRLLFKEYPELSCWPAQKHTRQAQFLERGKLHAHTFPAL